MNRKITKGFIITFKSELTGGTKGFEIHKLEDLHAAYEWCFEHGFKITEDFKHIRLQNFTPCSFE